MKKAIIIVGIIWGIMSLIAAGILIVVGAMSLGVIDQAAQELIKTQEGQGLTLDEARLLLLATAYMLIGFGSYFFANAVISFVLAGCAKMQSKVGGIVLGIVGIVLGSVPAGILTLVDSVKNRQRPVEPAQ